MESAVHERTSVPATELAQRAKMEKMKRVSIFEEIKFRERSWRGMFDRDLAANARLDMDGGVCNSEETL